MKLLATDYDGTLCYGEHIMDEDLEAIRRWKEAGNLYVVATGRSQESIKKQIEKFDLPFDYLICNNGGMIFDENYRELEANYLDTITAIDLMYAASEFEDVASLVVNDGRNRHKLVINPNVPDHRYPTMQPDMTLEEVMDIGKFAQIVLSMSSTEAALEMAEQINEFFSSQVTAFVNGYCVDVDPKGISKATGMDYITAYTDVDEPDIYTLGDAHNDIPLIEYGLNGAAIELAPEEVKERAARTYPSVSAMVDEIIEL